MKPELNIIENILLVNNRCLSEQKKEIVLKDLSSREAAILLSIREEEKITSNELAQRNNLSPSRISRIVENLCTKEYLSRHSDEEDRRYIKISLSENGKDHRKNIMSHNGLCENALKSKLNKDEFDIVQKALIILLKALETNENE